MRSIASILLCLVVIATGPLLARESTPLRQFAATLGLKNVDQFVEAISSLRDTGRLPARYISKGEAERGGWAPGQDLCRTAPGRSIGGDRFGNREGRLPRAQGRIWREADLDFACGKRGAARLLWSNDGMIFVTVDHYQSFHQVPP